MTTLNLKKQCGGYYTNTFEGVTITISNANCLVGGRSTNEDWELTIEDEQDVLFKSFFKTKKQCMEYGTKWIINNL